MNKEKYNLAIAELVSLYDWLLTLRSVFKNAGEPGAAVAVSVAAEHCARRVREISSANGGNRNDDLPVL